MIFRLQYLVVLLLLWTGVASGCSAVQRVSQADARQTGYLRMEVEPPDTRIYIDADYQGRVDGWVAQTIRLEPGVRQVELRAAGYISRRFDIEIEPGGQSVLTVVMEADLERLDGAQPERAAPRDGRARRPAAPSIPIRGASTPR